MRAGAHVAQTILATIPLAATFVLVTGDERNLATDQIHIEQLEVFARVGVTENERASPQRLTLTITYWPEETFEGLQDDITRTVNYSAMCEAAREYARERSAKLIETLAANLATHLLQVFPIQKIQIELRKYVLPDAKHAAVTVTRSAAIG